jgi:16S rRNA (uracil1498-N3)-methyltransferase
MGDAGGPPDRSSLHRFFVAPGDLEAGRVAFSPAQQAQIRRVLRLREGDRVIVCDDSGAAYLTSLHLAGHTVWGEVVATLPAPPPPRRAVWLYQSALRGDRFSWLLQKGTEIGVRGFVPVRFARTQPADYAARHDRYLAIVREAAEQCERALLPTVAPPMPFEEALHRSAGQPASRLLLDEAERAVPLTRALATTGDTVCLFIGPEGGLDETERTAARAAGLQPVGLGPAILRSETAGLVAATLALAASGDLG